MHGLWHPILPHRHLLAGAASGCPINNLIPSGTISFIAEMRSAHRLHKTNNFPEFHRRVLPAPCEGACVLGIIQPPVTIKSIGAAVADRPGRRLDCPEPPLRRTGKKSAVVGSAPRALLRAQLNKVGHSVTVFERADRIGACSCTAFPT